MQTTTLNVESFFTETMSNFVFTPLKSKLSAKKVMTTTINLKENPEGQTKNYLLKCKRISTPPKKLKQFNTDYTNTSKYKTDLLSSPIKSRCPVYKTHVKRRKHPYKNHIEKLQENDEIKKKLFEKSIELECLKELIRIYQNHFSDDHSNSLLLNQIILNTELTSDLVTVIMKTIISGFNSRDPIILFRFIVSSLINIKT